MLPVSTTDISERSIRISRLMRFIESLTVRGWPGYTMQFSCRDAEPESCRFPEFNSVRAAVRVRSARAHDARALHAEGSTPNQRWQCRSRRWDDRAAAEADTCGLIQTICPSCRADP